jgi:hypothetical protein
MKNIEQIMKELQAEMDYKWRVQSFSKKKPVATCVAYIDSRHVQNRLDEVLGVDKWQSDYKEVKGNLFAGIGIDFGTGFVWKWDCGTESNQDKEKGEASDSFKRAAVKFGIGRFLYDLPIKTVKSSEIKTNTNYPNVVDDNGNIVWDLTKHINSMNGKKDNPTPPKVQKLTLVEGSQNWLNCVKALKDGFSTDDLKRKYIISEEVNEKLINQASI